jgi:hypothetical protein
LLAGKESHPGNQSLKFLRQVFAHAVVADPWDLNPARDVPYRNSQSLDDR